MSAARRPTAAQRLLRTADPASSPAAAPASPRPRASGFMASGLGVALFSSAVFGLSGSFAKALLETGWTPGAAVTARLTGAALILAVPAIPALRGRWHQLRDNWLTVAAVRPHRRRRLPAVLLQRRVPALGRRRPAAGVPGAGAHRALALGRQPETAAAADHRRHPAVARRAGPGPGPHRCRQDRPHRRAVGDRGRRLPGHLLLHHGQGKRHPAADRAGLRRAHGGRRRHVARRGDRAAADGLQHGRHPPGPLGHPVVGGAGRARGPGHRPGLRLRNCRRAGARARRWRPSSR